MMKLIIALFFLLLVSAHAVKVFEEKKIIPEEVEGNLLDLLELLEENESLRRQVLWRINIIIILLFTTVSTFFFGFYLNCKQNVFLHQIEENQLADETRDEKVKSILSGLKYLHKSKIIHRDLKPRNVLILIKNKISIPKLSDMRVSKLLVDKFYVSPHVTDYGTSGWKAPGLLLHGRHDTSVDLFIIYHMSEGYDLISKLLNHNPSKRLNVEQALKHPFFLHLDFKMEFISIISDTIEPEWTNAILNHHQKAEKGGKYDHSSLAALLRLLSNSRSHFIELSKDVDMYICGCFVLQCFLNNFSFLGFSVIILMQFEVNHISFVD